MKEKRLGIEEYQMVQAFVAGKSSGKGSSVYRVEWTKNSFQMIEFINKSR